MVMRPTDNQACNTHPCLPTMYKDEVVTQGSSLVIDKQQYYSEGSSITGKNLNGMYVYSSHGGVTQDAGTVSVFYPSGRYGDYDSGGNVTYMLTSNGIDTALICVKVTVGILSETTAVLTYSSESLSFLQKYRPPSFSDIFYKWPRFGNNTHYNAGAHKGEASSWYLNGNNVYLGVNSEYPTGFISPEKFTKYTHEAVLSSTSGDNDQIGLVIAYTNVGNTPHMLIAIRSNGGQGYGQGRGFSVIYQTVTGSHTCGAIIRRLPSGYKCKNKGSSGWDSISPTKLWIERTLTTVTVRASPYGSTNLDNGEKIVVDLTRYTKLQWARNACRYGYIGHSQGGSTFSSIKFDSDEHMKNIVSAVDTGDVWKWIDPPGTWQKQGTTIQDVYGYPRYIVDATTKLRYLILEDTVILIPEGTEDPI